MHRFLIWAAAGLLAIAPAAGARGGSASSARASSKSASVSPGRSKARKAAACTTCARDSHGKIKRSAAAKRDFQKSHPCPSTGKTAGACSGYVIDHVVPLKRGGADAPGNMQWQTKAAAKAKDRLE